MEDCNIIMPQNTCTDCKKEKFIIDLSNCKLCNHCVCDDCIINYNDNFSVLCDNCFEVIEHDFHWAIIELIKRRKPSLIIYDNNELGKRMFSVLVDKQDDLFKLAPDILNEYWLDSFKTLKEVEDFCKELGCKYTV